MENVSKDVLFMIAIDMDYPDILKFCSTSKRINRDICANNNFWRNKLYKKYPFLLPHIQKRNDLKFLYRDVEKEIEKLKTKSDRNNSFNTGFDKLKYISPEFTNFFLNADFGNISGTVVPFNYVLWPLLQKGIFTMALAQRLITIHLKKYKYYDEDGIKVYYSASPDMNLYLNNTLTELENDGTKPFDRNKFFFKNISRIFLKGFSNKDSITPERYVIDIAQNIDKLSVKRNEEVYGVFKI